jgi:cyclophilin family peptidyl-prolyl cis-trans isomerase
MPSSYHDGEGRAGLFDGQSGEALTSGIQRIEYRAQRTGDVMRRDVLYPMLLLLLSTLGWAAWPSPPAAEAGAGAVAYAASPGPDTAQGGTAAVHAPPLQAPPLEPAPGNPVGVIATSMGDITVELFKEQAPVSVENFSQYVQEGFYDGTIFHRVIPKFMIQGGGYTPALVEKPTRPPILNEATNGLRNVRGTLGMARRQSLRSATAQFYINVADNRMLDHTGYSPMDFGYAVFGRVLNGMEVADAIAGVPTGMMGGMPDVPLEPVTIKSIRLQP